MARRLEWSQLKTGIIGATVVTSLALGVLLFAKVGQLRGETDTIYVYSDDADGVLPGTEVWLSGEKIGQVKRIRFRPPGTDTTRRLSIEALIIASKRHFIRRDARVDIRPGGNLIGTPVIYIQGGTSRAPAIVDGDTLVTISSSAFKPLGERVSALSAKLTELADSSKRLTTLIGSSKTTVGAFTQGGMPAMAGMMKTMGQLTDKATAGEGSLGLAARGDLGARFARIMAAKDSVIAAASAPGGNLDRFQKDSALMRDIVRIKAQLDSLKAKFSARGTIARAQSDSSLSIAMARMNAELAAVMADLKKNPGRYIAF